MCLDLINYNENLLIFRNYALSVYQSEVIEESGRIVDSADQFIIYANSYFPKLVAIFLSSVN